MLHIKPLTAAALALAVAAAAPVFGSDSHDRSEADNHQAAHVDARASHEEHAAHAEHAARDERGQVSVARDEHRDSGAARDIHADHRVEVTRDVHEDRGVDRGDHWDRGHWDEHHWYDHDHDHGFLGIDVVPDYAYPYPEPAYVTPNTDQYVPLQDVPQNVVATVVDQDLGPIESVQYVEQPGRVFYRFIVEGRVQELDVRVALDGRLLGINPV